MIELDSNPSFYEFLQNLTHHTKIFEQNYQFIIFHELSLVLDAEIAEKDSWKNFKEISLKLHKIQKNSSLVVIFDQSLSNFKPNKNTPNSSILTSNELNYSFVDNAANIYLYLPDQHSNRRVELRTIKSQKAKKKNNIFLVIFNKSVQRIFYA